LSADSGLTWKVVLRANRDVFRIAFTDAGQGWASGDDGALWESRNGGQDWAPAAAEADAPVSASCLRLAPSGAFGVAPLRTGMVLILDGKRWERVRVPGFDEYSLPDAAVAGDRAYVLGSQGQVARWVPR
jgi:photosystem II stability/assembly factor-like uncharacterized protein